MERSKRRSLIFYLLFAILGAICQLPFVILICKFFFSGLIDNLFIIYIICLLLFVLLSISLFCFLCLFPSSSWNFTYLDKLRQGDRSTSLETLNRSVYSHF